MGRLSLGSASCNMLLRLAPVSYAVQAGEVLVNIILIVYISHAYPLLFNALHVLGAIDYYPQMASILTNISQHHVCHGLQQFIMSRSAGVRGCTCQQPLACRHRHSTALTTLRSFHRLPLCRLLLIPAALGTTGYSQPSPEHCVPSLLFHVIRTQLRVNVGAWKIPFMLYAERRIRGMETNKVNSHNNLLSSPVGM